MASTIDYVSIDATFPVAGKDNDSQGFRDNFSVIRNNFESAKGEIEDLQLNTVRLDTSNDFSNQSTFTQVNFSRYTNSFFPGGLISSQTNLSVNNGPYQYFLINSDLQIIVKDWPEVNNLSKITVELVLYDANPTRNVTFTFDGASTTKKHTNWPGSTSVPISTVGKSHIFEFWTYDQGITVFCNYLGAFT